MSFDQILPAVMTLSRAQKYQLAHLLLDELASEEPFASMPEGHVFWMHTPEYAPAAAAQLAQVLMAESANP